MIKLQKCPAEQFTLITNAHFPLVIVIYIYKLVYIINIYIQKENMPRVIRDIRLQMNNQKTK